MRRFTVKNSWKAEEGGGGGGGMGLCQKGLCSNKEATNMVSKVGYSPLLKPLQNGYSIVIIVQTSCIPNVDSHLNSGYQDLSILLLLFFILYELIPLFICWAQIPFPRQLKSCLL